MLKTVSFNDYYADYYFASFKVKNYIFRHTSKNDKQIDKFPIVTKHLSTLWKYNDEKLRKV